MARQCFHVFGGVRPWLVPHQGLQLPMSHKVRVASNRTGEVRIGVEIKSEMTGVGGGVARPLHQLEEALVHHASRCPGQLTRRALGLAQGVEHGTTGLWVNHLRTVVFLVRLGVGFDGDAARPTRQQVGQLLRRGLARGPVRRHGEFDVHIQGLQPGVQRLDLDAIGGQVTPPRQGRAGCSEQLPNRCICGHHEGLNHRRSVVWTFDVHVDFSVSRQAGAKFCLMQLQPQITLTHARGECKEIVHLAAFQHLVVGAVGPDTDDGFMWDARSDAVAVEAKFEHHGAAVNVRPKAAQVVRQAWRKHGQHGVWEIDGRGPGAGRSVQWRVLTHVRRHVGDGHPQGPVVLREAHGVVEIFRVMRVNRHEGEVAQVGASGRHIRVSVDLFECIGDLHQVRLPGLWEGIVALAGTLPEPCFNQGQRIHGAGGMQQVRHVRGILAEAESADAAGPRDQRLVEVKAVPREHAFSFDQGPRLWPGLQRSLEQPAMEHLSEDLVRAFRAVEVRLPPLAGLRCGLDRLLRTQSHTGIGARQPLSSLGGLAQGRVEGGAGTPCIRSLGGVAFSGTHHFPEFIWSMRPFRLLPEGVVEAAPEPVVVWCFWTALTLAPMA